jgi:hypothetical protein
LSVADRFGFDSFVVLGLGVVPGSSATDVWSMTGLSAVRP